jgi:hypothetical protein
MSLSQKYGRTLHYPFSPGATQDDKINEQYWQDIVAIPQLIHTEKLDGENNCLSAQGVFARSHAAPTTSPWTQHLRQFWSRIRYDLGHYEIFLENLYATHSIAYTNLPSYYFVFAVREHDQWLSWAETTFIARFFDLPTVPVLAQGVAPAQQQQYQKELLAIAAGRGAFAPADVHTGKPCTMEGIVTRNYNQYPVAAFAQNVFKYVRANHVQTTEHWTKNWKRATLNHQNHVDNQ